MTAAKGGLPNVGELIRKKRKEMGLTQKELAEKMSLTQSAVSQLENGSITPSYELLFKLAEALSTTPSFFFQEDVYSQEEEKVSNVFLKLQRLYLNFEYEKMPAVWKEEEQKSYFQDPRNKAILLLWKAKYYMQTFQMKDGLIVCFYILDHYRHYLSRFNLGETYRVIADLYCILSIMADANPAPDEYLKEAIYYFKLAQNYLKVEHQNSEVYKKVLYGLGSCYDRMGDEERAEFYYRQCEDLCDKDLKLSNSYKANIRVMKSLQAKTKGKYDEALKLLDEAESLYKVNEEHRNIMNVWYNKANILEIKGEKAQALQVYKDLKEYMDKYPQLRRTDHIEPVTEKIQMLSKILFQDPLIQEN